MTNRGAALKPDLATALSGHQAAAPAVLHLDGAGVVRSANRAAVALLGGAESGVAGCAFDDFWPWPLPVAEECHYAETVLRGGNGRPFPAALTLTPTLDGVLCLIVPHHHGSDWEEAVRRMERLVSIGLLTTSVAHELNTPISVIAATCSNLLHEINADGIDAAQLAHYVQLIDQSGRRAARTLDVLRSYSYDEDLHAAVTDLNLVVEDALALVRQQFQSEFNVEIEATLSPHLKSLIADHNRLTQVLLVLLTNACESMASDGGMIRIRTWALASDELELAGDGPFDGEENGLLPVQTTVQNDLNGFAANWPSGLHYGIAITDAGCGIDEALLPHIFTPFFTTKPAGRGTGLGLYIARQIVLQHNGRLLVANNPDGGTTFTLLLPRKP